MKSKYSVEKRTADERFTLTIPGLDYAVGDVYFVLKEHEQVVAWAHTEDGAWACRL